MFKLYYSRHYVNETEEFPTLEEALTRVYWMGEMEQGWPYRLENLETQEIVSENEGPFETPLSGMAHEHVESSRKC